MFACELTKHQCCKMTLAGLIAPPICDLVIYHEICDSKSTKWKMGISPKKIIEIGWYCKLWDERVQFWMKILYSHPYVAIVTPMIVANAPPLRIWKRNHWFAPRLEGGIIWNLTAMIGQARLCFNLHLYLGQSRPMSFHVDVTSTWNPTRSKLII